MNKTVDRITTTTSNLKIKRFEKAKQIQPELTQSKADELCKLQNTLNSSFLDSVAESLDKHELGDMFRDNSNLLKIISLIYKSDSFPECGTAIFNLASLFMIVKSNTTRSMSFEEIKAIAESMGKTEDAIIKSEQLLLDSAQLSINNFQKLIDDYKEFLFTDEPVNLDFEVIDYDAEMELEKQEESGAFVN